MRSQFKRTGAFIGTVAAVVIAEHSRRSKIRREIDAVSHVFQSGLKAALQTSENCTRANTDINHISIIDRAMLFAHIPTVFEADTLEKAVCRWYDWTPETWEDVELLADICADIRNGEML